MAVAESTGFPVPDRSMWVQLRPARWCLIAAGDLWLAHWVQTIPGVGWLGAVGIILAGVLGFVLRTNR